MKKQRTHSNPEKPITLKNEDDLFEIVESNKDKTFLLILDNVQDPHNLGACLRSADAAGVHAVVIPKDRSVGMTDTVRHIAAGAAENIPLITVTNLARTLEALKKMGIWLVGTADEAEQLIYDIDLNGPIAIVMGAEGKGLRRLTRENCDFLGKLPMNGSVDCLNVSVATGICLFEVIRQRNYSR